MFGIDIHQNMLISLFKTSFDHFQFRPTSGMTSIHDLTVCLMFYSFRGCKKHGLAGIPAAKMLVNQIHGGIKEAELQCLQVEIASGRNFLNAYYSVTKSLTAQTHLKMITRARAINLKHM